MGTLNFNDTTDTFSEADGHGLILDESYRIVADVRSGSGRGGIDMHEFRISGNGQTALATIFDTTAADLSSENITESLGWIVDSGFQEISITTNNVVFDWHSADHIHPSESLFARDGMGSSLLSPWDYLHINSVEKSQSGDYLVSARHTSAIYLVSHVDGSLIWRLGGRNSSFEAINFELAFQHDVRILAEGPDSIKISLFNNGWDGDSEAVNERSYAAIIELDLRAGTAFMSSQFGLESNILSRSMGNVQVFDSGNALVGWGSTGVITEYDKDGGLIFKASMANTAAKNYRISKGSWKGRPSDVPSLWAYARNKQDAEMMAYASWNGATHVKRWRIFAGHNRSDPSSFSMTGEGTRSGFETMIVSVNDASAPYVFAEALGSDGTSLANSSTQAIFVPGSELAKHCSAHACPMQYLAETRHRLPHLASVPQQLQQDLLSAGRPVNKSFAISSDQDRLVADIPHGKMVVRAPVLYVVIAVLIASFLAKTRRLKRAWCVR